jgi:hypothetical protein
MTYGCKDRAPFVTGYWARDGYAEDYNGDISVALPKVAWIPHRLSKDCEYSKHDKYADIGCNGCKWRVNESK